MRAALRPVLIRYVVGVTILAAIGASSFAVMRVMAEPSAADADSVTFQPPPEPITGQARGSRWFETLTREDDQKEKFDGVMNGIRIGPSVTRSLSDHEACQDAHTHSTSEDPAVARNSVIDPFPSYLPSGADQARFTATLCVATIINAGVEYAIPVGTSSAWGGALVIARLTGEPSVHALWSSDRLSSAQIGSRNAVVIRPLTADGWGPSAVYIKELWGITLVQGFNLTTDELIRVADALASKGGSP